MHDFRFSGARRILMVAASTAALLAPAGLHAQVVPDDSSRTAVPVAGDAPQDGAAASTAAQPAGQNSATTDPSADDMVVGEVVVTAQRQSQRLQDVPIAITAVTGAAIQARGIRTTDDLNVAVPGLTVSRSISTGLLYLRGVGNNSTNPGQEPNVGFYVDGVYYATVVSDLSSFGRNVDHIEVLKGPQGTLFGRNTTGGLIQVVTKTPSNVWGGNVSFGYGNYDTVFATGYLTGGITDNMAIDLSVNYVDQGKGWGRNIVRNEDAYFRDDLNLRSKLVWDVGVATKITATVDYNRIKSDIGSARQILEGIPRTPASLGSIVFNGSIYDTQSNAPVLDRIEGGGGAVRIDHDAGPFRVASISAYRTLTRRTFLDLDNTPAASASASYDPQRAKTFSQELQILALQSSRVQWIAGLYYFNANDGVHPLTIFNEALGPALFQRIDVSLLTDSFAGYAQATFPIFGDRTKLTLGGRYTIDDKHVRGSATTALAPLYTVNTGQSFSQATYRVALDHKFSDDILGYVSINTGFKSGLFNATAPNQPAVSPEKITAYEAGLKTELFGRRARFNVAGFYYDYKDLQLTRFTGTATQLQNAATAKVYGLEVETEARLTQGLTFTGGLSVLKSEYTSFPNAVSFLVSPTTGLGVQTIVDAAGNQLQRTPKLTGNAALDYRFPIGSGTGGANATYYYNDGFFFEPDNQLRQSAYSLVNAELSYAGPDNRYKVRLWGRNLFDKQYFNNLGTGNRLPPFGSAAAPRTYGGTVEFAF